MHAHLREQQQQHIYRGVYSQLLQSFAELQLQDDAMALLRQMQTAGVTPKHGILNLLIDNCDAAGQTEWAEELHALRRGLPKVFPPHCFV